MTPDQATALRPKLPSGWLAKAQELLTDQGCSYTESMISKVKNAHKQNLMIEEVLLLLANIEQERIAELDRRIDAIGKHNMLLAEEAGHH